jgi:hypothetical protein
MQTQCPLPPLSDAATGHSLCRKEYRKIELTKGVFWLLLKFLPEVLVDILQQMIDVVYGTKVYLPETKIVLGIVLGLALLIYLKGPLGGLVTSVLVTVLVGQSYFSQGDINQLSTERVVAGVILGLILFFTNLYFLVRTIADWKD